MDSSDSPEGTGGTTPEQHPEIAPEPGAVDPAAVEPVRPSRLPVVIGVVVVLALLVGGSLFLLLRDGGQSEEDEAGDAVVAFVEGTVKVAQGDKSGCKQIAEAVWTKDDQDIRGDCEEDDGSTFNPDIELVSAKVTKVTLEEKTGKVTIKVTTSSGGKEDSQTSTVDVRKIDGDWLLDGSKFSG